MKVILFIGIFCLSIGAAFAADLKVGDKCVTSSGDAGTVAVKYTEKGEAVGLKCVANSAARAHGPAVLPADKQARRAEKPAASSGQTKAIDGKPFKFEILPSEKCVLQQVPNEDPVLKCINLKTTAPVGPPINPTNPGDPRPANKQTKRMPTSPSEMQTVLDWCKKKRGTWTPDGRNGGTCRFPSVKIFDRWGIDDCKKLGGVWDGGDGKGDCTGPLKWPKK